MKRILSAGFWPAVMALRAGAAGLLLTASPESRLRLDGDSTLHRYWSRATRLDAALTIEAGAASAEAAAAAAAAGRPANLTVTIPVAGLRSKHSGLDKNLRAALKADKNPDIVFILDRYQASSGEGALKLAASGTLSVAGGTKAVTLAGAASVAGGRFVIEGAHSLLMSDFGIKPPTMMMGAVKTADTVRITYHLELAPKGAP